MAGLFVGAEDMRRLGGPGPMAGDAVHQIDQSDIALVQVLDVLRRSAAARSARRARETPPELAACSTNSSRSSRCQGMQSTCRIRSSAGNAALAWPLHTPVQCLPMETTRGVLNVQAPSPRRCRPRSLRCDCIACLFTGHSAHRHDSRRHSADHRPARPGLRRLPLRRLHDLRRAGELGPLARPTRSPTSSPASPPNGRRSKATASAGSSSCARA